MPTFVVRDQKSISDQGRGGHFGSCPPSEADCVDLTERVKTDFLAGGQRPETVG